VTIVGEVVRLRERLRWFDLGPLAGKRVVVTRAREQASGFAEKLRAKGAEPIEFPLIRLVPPTDGYAALDSALVRVGTYDWVCFASAPAVYAFCDRLMRAGKDGRALASARIAAVGPATAEALAARGLVVDFQPQATTGSGLGAELPGEIGKSNVLVPRAGEGDEGMVEALRARGAVVDAVTAYENVLDGAGADEVRERLRSGTIDAVTFTSSSTVKNFVAALDGAALPPGVVVACIGPSTAQTAREMLGREPEVVAAEHTTEGLIAALEEFHGIHPAAGGKGES